MKILISTLFLIAGMALAADKPDFSGNWKLDPDKSSFGPLPTPDSMTRKIEHNDPNLSYNETRTGPDGDQNMMIKYSTDGKEVTNSMMGNDIKSKASWDGNALVITGTANIGGGDVKLSDRWTLSDDGKTLTDALNISAPQGEFKITYVLVKQ